jgi:hypothetical protein
MKLFAFCFSLALLMIASCTTEVDLMAPYKSTTVVFGLLNPDANADNVLNALDTQWIKINRTFLGEGDNTVFAGVRDSSEYDDSEIETKVVQQLHDGEVVQEFELTSVTVANKSIDGIFYGPEQTLYYFIPPASGLFLADEYRIYVKFTDGHEVSGTTNVVNYSSFSWIAPQQETNLNMASPSSQNGGIQYVDPVSVRWGAARNASVYSVVLRFHYTEEIYDNVTHSGTPLSSTPKYIDYSIGTKSAEGVAAGETMKIEFRGEDFYSFVVNNIDVNPYARRILGRYDNALDQERTECFDVIMTIGNEQLSSYIEVNSPATTIVQERPVYTNIDNGLGLFASRGLRQLLDVRLVGEGPNGVATTGNLEAFFIAGGTEELNFCDPNPSSSHACN